MSTGSEIGSGLQQAATSMDDGTMADADAQAAVHSAVTLAHETLDWYIFGIMTIILVLLSYLLVTNLTFQRVNYQSGLGVALTTPTDHAAALTYARASDAAVIKLSALFLGFLLVFTGALYVLRSATTQFKLQGSRGNASGTLETSSPGLVVVTLGVLLVATALLSKNDVVYESTAAPDDTKPAATIQQDGATPVASQPTLQMEKP